MNSSDMPKPKKREYKPIIVEGKAFSLEKGKKYLVIFPTDAIDENLGRAIKKFFPEIKILAIGANNPDEVRIAEYMEES